MVKKKKKKCRDWVSSSACKQLRSHHFNLTAYKNLKILKNQQFLTSCERKEDTVQTIILQEWRVRWILGVKVYKGRFISRNCLGNQCLLRKTWIVVELLEAQCGGSDSKESAWNAGDMGLIPGFGKIPWRRKWQPTPIFLPGESHGLELGLQALTRLCGLIWVENSRRIHSWPGVWKQLVPTKLWGLPSGALLNSLGKYQRIPLPAFSRERKKKPFWNMPGHSS